MKYRHIHCSSHYKLRKISKYLLIKLLKNCYQIVQWSEYSHSCVSSVWKKDRIQQSNHSFRLLHMSASFSSNVSGHKQRPDRTNHTTISNIFLSLKLDRYSVSAWCMKITPHAMLCISLLYMYSKWYISNLPHAVNWKYPDNIGLQITFSKNTQRYKCFDNIPYYIVSVNC